MFLIVGDHCGQPNPFTIINSLFLTYDMNREFVQAMSQLLLIVFLAFLFPHFVTLIEISIHRFIQSFKFYSHR
jgi:hypothetical protein